VCGFAAAGNSKITQSFKEGVDGNINAFLFLLCQSVKEQVGVAFL
jgi:hypothetical protein